MAATTDLTDKTFEQTIRTNAPVLIDFWGDDCIPCKMMKPIVDGIRSKYKGKMFVYNAHINSCSRVIEQYHIKSLPTLILLKEGKLVDKFTGFIREDMLCRRLESYIN